MPFLVVVHRVSVWLCNITAACDLHCTRMLFCRVERSVLCPFDASMHTSRHWVILMFAYGIQVSTAKGLRIAIAVLVLVVNVAFAGYCLWKLAHVHHMVLSLFVKVDNLVKSRVLWVVEAALLCTGHARAGPGKRHRRRVDAWCCRV